MSSRTIVYDSPSEQAASESTRARSRVLLVDDHAVVRQGIAQLINQQADLIVCGEAEDEPKALEAMDVSKPDVAVVDISLGESNGLELIKHIQERYPKFPILVVTMHTESLYALLAIRAGALGYITKLEAIDKLLAGIRGVLSGKFYLSARLRDEILQQHFRKELGLQNTPVDRLTERELEVFQLIGLWHGTSQIARELNLSVKTIEYYREQIKEKLNLKTSSKLIRSATERVEREKPLRAR
jgi:DNA-binding NarL/FixJ family response regulator